VVEGRGEHEVGRKGEKKEGGEEEKKWLPAQCGDFMLGGIDKKV
jgi:hypothetical protein